MRSYSQSIVCVLVAASVGAPAWGQCEPGELHRLLGDQAQSNFNFGIAVDMRGDLAIVSSRLDRVNGVLSGAAYLFEVSSGTRLAWIPSPEPRDFQYFGISLALSGNYALVGTWGEEGDGVFGYDITDPTLPILMVELQPDDAPVESFGRALTVGEGSIVVGARYDNDQRGAAYVFDAGTLTQRFKLTAADGDPGDIFGESVAVGGGYVLVGAPYYDGSESGSGAAYVFDAATGAEVRKIEPESGQLIGNFGSAVAISGTTALVGAPGEQSGDVYDGAVYLFDLANGARLFTILGPYDAAGRTGFGSTLDASGETAIIGTSMHHAPGEAYLYDISDPALPRETGLLSPSDSAPGDRFGTVAIDGDQCLVGAPGHSGSAEGAGAAYVFPTSCACAADFNGDGVVDTRDFVAFLNAWAAGDPRADFDGNGVIDTRDFIAYLNLWAAGC